MFTNLENYIGKPQKVELPEFMETVAEGKSVKNFTYQGFDDFNVAPIVAVVIPQPEIAEFTAPVSQPIFTVEDMELAKTLARDEGVQMGRKEAEKDFAAGVTAAEVEEEVRIADLLEKINIQLMELNLKSAVSNEKLINETSEVAISIAKKVCGKITLGMLESDVGVLIEELKDKLGDNEIVNIFLHPENFAELNSKFTNASLNMDEKIAVGDFRVEWKNGFAEKNLVNLWKTIEEVCSRHSAVEENIINNEGNNG